jgi:GAF domain-containing protein
MEAWRLSTDIHIEKGAAPGAGFAEAKAPQPAQHRGEEFGGPPQFSDLMRLKLLLDAVNSGERFLNFSETLSIVAARLKEMAPFDSLAVYVPRGSTLKAAFAMGALPPAAIPRGQGVSGWAMEANRPILNANAAVELCYSAVAPQSAEAGSALAMPLPGSMGPAGVLTIYSPGDNAFDSRHLDALAGIASQLGAYLERSARETRLTHQPRSSAYVPPIIAPPAKPAESALLIQ